MLAKEFEKKQKKLTDQLTAVDSAVFGVSTGHEKVRLAGRFLLLTARRASAAIIRPDPLIKN